MLKELYFIRHGKSVCNVLRENGDARADLEENIDTELAEEGIRQAAHLSKFTASLGVEVILCSPLRRTLKTANIAFSRLESAIPISIHSRVREKYWGDHENRGLGKNSPREFLRMESSSLPACLVVDEKSLEFLESDEDEFWDPVAEKGYSAKKKGVMAERCASSALELILRREEQKIAVVCHWGNFMHIFNVNPDNCCCYKVVVECEDGKMRRCLETAKLDQDSGVFKAVNFPNPHYRVRKDPSKKTTEKHDCKEALIAVCGAGWWLVIFPSF